MQHAESFSRGGAASPAPLARDWRGGHAAACSTRRVFSFQIAAAETSNKASVAIRLLLVPLSLPARCMSQSAVYYRSDGVRITHDPHAKGMAAKYGSPGQTDADGFDPYADSVGAGSEYYAGTSACERHSLPPRSICETHMACECSGERKRACRASLYVR